MDDEDLLIENILDRKQPKKKKDGKAKGDRTERGLCEYLTKHFGEEFTKAPGSGALATIRESLPEHAKKTLTGDICAPEGFRWVIECKGGYEDKIDLNNVLEEDGIAKLNDFIEQSTRDANYCGRKPIICWKRNRKPWLCMLHLAELHRSEYNYQHRIHYGEWVILPLEEILQNTSRGFWFEERIKNDSSSNH